MPRSAPVSAPAPAPRLRVIRAPRRAAPHPTLEPATSATQRIVEAISQAVIARRLMPGTKLTEQKLADIFKVSRTIVRQALNQLSRHKLVTLEAARGARVTEPGIEEARQVFDVRNMLEAAMIKRAATALKPAQIAELRTHLAAEAAAVKRTDLSVRTHLLADFHVLLARMLGNTVLAEMLGELVSRCSLIALMYQSAHSAEHSYAEHVAIVDALEKRDARAAVKLMEEHLHHVERNLQLDPRTPDLASVLLGA